MEMNARTQAEHPVTYYGMNVDVLEWGIRTYVGRSSSIYLRFGIVSDFCIMKEKLEILRELQKAGIIHFETKVSLSHQEKLQLAKWSDERPPVGYLPEHFGRIRIVSCDYNFFVSQKEPTFLSAP